MTRVFSTQLDEKVLRLLNGFCRRYHMKKSSVLEDLIAEGIRRKTAAFELAESIERGLEQEKEGTLYPADEVENLLFGKKRKTH